MITDGPAERAALFREDELLPISALQHLLFCERQCALIHIERLWAENRLTVEGRHLHDKAHGKSAGPRGGGLVEARGRAGGCGVGVRIARAAAVRSLRLGLHGVADTVEFHARPEGGLQVGSTPPEHAPPFPVEYKRGRPKKHDADRVQLCAQALCLEEMLGVDVPAGALFYGRTRRREQVAFDAGLRQLTEQTTARLHALIRSRCTPPAVYEKAKCERCSLINLCMPMTPHSRAAASRYLERALADAATMTPGSMSPDPAASDCGAPP